MEAIKNQQEMQKYLEKKHPSNILAKLEFAVEKEMRDKHAIDIE